MRRTHSQSHASPVLYLDSSCESVRRKYEECRCERDCTRSGTPVSVRSEQDLRLARSLNAHATCALMRQPSPYVGSAASRKQDEQTRANRSAFAHDDIELSDSIEWAGRADRSCDLLL